jgi:hypothetical protein
MTYNKIVIKKWGWVSRNRNSDKRSLIGHKAARGYQGSVVSDNLIKADEIIYIYIYIGRMVVSALLPLGFAPCKG